MANDALVLRLNSAKAECTCLPPPPSYFDFIESAVLSINVFLFILRDVCVS